MTPVLAPESPDLVWFEGDDAVRFLNDLLSQEIGDLEPGVTVRSFLLSPQGKLDHILWVIREDGRVGLLTEPGRGEELAATLGRYRIRVDVEISISTEDVWVVLGPYEGLDISWPTQGRKLVMGAKPALPVIGVDDYERMRIEAGEPRFGVDVDASTIPQESGMVEVAVDFEKGCFLGQELVARIDSRGGSAPRRLRILEFDLPAPEPGAEVIVGDQRVGAVSSVSGERGLGLLHRDVAPGDEVRVAGSTATVL
jgi:folate-binding protein YgfZ